VIGPAAVGNEFTVIGKLLLVPFPQEFTPNTLKFPAVAVAEKAIVTVLLVPVIVAPIPE
jgi:hypothetical protein